MSYRPAGLSDEEDSEDDFEIWTESSRSSNYHSKPEINQVESKESIFYQALKNHEIDTLRQMIKEGFNVDQQLAGGWSALLHACSMGSLPIVTLLVQENANVNFTKELFSPLMALCKSNVAVEDELLKCLNVLLDHGATVDAMDRHACTALMNASGAGYTLLVKRLIEAKCDLNIQDSEGWSALFHAVDKERECVVKLLVEEKARLDLIDRRRRSAFDLAMIKGLDHLGKLVCSKKEKRRLLEDEKNVCIKDVKVVKDIVENLFNQLPAQDKESVSGFSSEVEKLLWSMGQRHYIKSFEQNSIQLNEFLLINNERLKELGVRFSAHRQRILNSIRKFHLHPWHKSSLGMKPTNHQMNIDDGVKLMCNATKHFHVLNATVNYVSKYQPVPAQPEVFKLCESAMHQLNLVMSELRSIQSHAVALKKREQLEPVDLLKPRESHRNYFSLLVTAAFFTWAVVKVKSYYKG